MASFRRPRGTVVRHIPDWKTGQLCTSADSTTGGGLGTDNGFGLFNDTGQGQMLVVWHVYGFCRPVVSPSQIQLATLGFFTGPPFPVLSPGQPLDLLVASPGGSTWPLPSSPFLITNAIMDVPMSPTGWEWKHDYPLCVVRPGTSLIFDMFGPVQDVAIGFMWEVTSAI